MTEDTHGPPPGLRAYPELEPKSAPELAVDEARFAALTAPLRVGRGVYKARRGEIPELRVTVSYADGRDLEALVDALTPEPSR